jgi:predicted transcriptional regulator
VKTHEKVIEALKNGPQTKEQVSVTALVPASQVNSAIQVLQNKGIVASSLEHGRRLYHLTGKS